MCEIYNAKYGVWIKRDNRILIETIKERLEAILAAPDATAMYQEAYFALQEIASLEGANR